MDVESKPDWDGLYELADSQGGYFTLNQAQGFNFSSQYITKLLNRKMERIRRGIYRLVHYPIHEKGGLIVYWLWSERIGVFSHESALFLHQLSDVLPKYTTITLPLAWKNRRWALPEGLMLQYSEKSPPVVWIEGVPVTNILRTLEDCQKEPHLYPFFIEALTEAEERGLISEENIETLKAMAVDV